MAILFRKTKRFQYGGPIDKMNPNAAHDLGVEYVGKHPRSLYTKVRKEFDNIHSGAYDEHGKLHVYDSKSNDITNQVMAGKEGDVYAANTPEFPRYAREAKALFGGNEIRTPVKLVWSPEFAKHTSSGNMGAATNFKGIIGSLIYKGGRNEPEKVFPLSAEDYLKYQESIGPLLEDRGQGNQLKSYFTK